MHQPQERESPSGRMLLADSRGFANALDLHGPYRSAGARQLRLIFAAALSGLSGGFYSFESVVALAGERAMKGVCIRDKPT